MTSTKKLERKKTLIWLRFIDFDLDRRWRLVEGTFSTLPKIQWNEEYEVSHEIWNITIYQNYQFLRRLYHPKSTNLIYHRLFKT